MSENQKNKNIKTLSATLEQAEIYIYLATAYILMFAAAGFLLYAVFEMILKVQQGEFLGALLNMLDRALLVLMLAEIIYTVGRVARKLRLEIEPFLIIGVIAAIRRILVITAESVEHVNMADPVFQATLAELGLLSVAILMMAIAMRLLRMDGEEEH